MAEQISRAEAIQFVTMQKDRYEDAMPDGRAAEAILLETGKKIGYAPAFRCLVAGLSPEDSIKWGK